MRVLFSTGSAARYMLPPLLGDEQVNCGPDWTDDVASDGRVRSLATPTGEYDLAAIAAKLPADQQPDVVVTLVDASWRNTPKNLGAFKCPRVLLIADTHHLRSPLIGMMRYASSEPYHRMVLLYDRHHADFFRGAGFDNLFWLPGLTFPHSDAVVATARQPVSNRTSRLAFVGQTGGLHWRRTRLLGAVAARGLPVETRVVPQQEALAFYGDSSLGFNASLNGDLNLRVFEILSSGAGLLTDQLSPASGLEQLFHVGREIVTYRDPAELAERVQHYTSNVAAAHALGAAGARWFDTHYNENQRRAAFQHVAFDGVAAPLFSLDPPGSTSVFFGGDTDRLLQSLMVYEGVQELHRSQETVRVLLDEASAPADFAAICQTLPRVQVTSTLGEGKFELAVYGRERAAAAPVKRVSRLWCWDATADDLSPLAEKFAAAGLALVSNDVAVFCRDDATTSAEAKAADIKPGEQIAQARALFKKGNLNAAFTLARSALEADPRSLEARVLLGELALRRHGGPLAEKLFRQALELRPGNVEFEVLLADALRLQGKFGPAGEILIRVLKGKKRPLGALLTLAKLRIEEKQPVAAEAALREAVRHHREPATAQALGEFLKRSGRIVEALGWYRKARGCDDPVPLIDPRARPVRIAFIVQHPQGWTSTQSVWEAFSADPAFETTVIAAPYRHPYPPEGGPEAIFEFLHQQGVPFVRWDAFRFRPNFADVVFLQNPYDVTRPESLQTSQLLKLVPRLAYVPYGLEIGGGDVNAQNQFNLPLQQFAWAVFARSARHRAMFAQHCAVGDAHVEITGHPRLDMIRTLDQLTPDPEFVSFARGRKIVFWNPQFDVRPDGTGYSTFMIWQKFLLEEFSRRQNLAFVIRPHPLFFGTLECRQLWTAAQVADFLQRVERAGNILIDRRASYLPVFAASTAMLSDASTFLLEYAATGKPLCYLHNPKGPQLNSDGTFITTHACTAERAEQIVAFLDQVTRGEDPTATARMAAYGEVMHVPDEGVAQTIKRIVRDRLASEAGVSQPQLAMN